MARDRRFSLELDVNNPRDKDCKDKNGRPADTLTSQEFRDMLDSGSLKAFGQIYRGKFPSLAEDSAGYSSELEPLARKCLVIYVGGTAYKICS
jgi:hypothetical protein